MRALLSGGIILLLILLAGGALAKVQTTETGLPADTVLAETLKNNSYNVVIIAAICLVVLVGYSIFAKPRKEKIKRILFWSIAFLAVGSNLYLAGATIYLNSVSPTGGPVHWHTDFEVWNCGQKLDLIDPTGIDNRVGTWEVHEHNDDRMHIEGTITQLNQASYHHFFETVGGNVAENGFTYPTNNGNVFIPRTGTCEGRPAELQAFLLHVDNPLNAKNWMYSQKKIAYPWDTTMQPYSNVPPGDCLIIEFDQMKNETTHSCASYRAAMNRGELHGR